MDQIISYLSNIDPILAALYASLFTWIVTALGASLVFFFKGMNRGLLDGMLGFTGGVMVAASFWSLLAPSIEMSSGEGFVKVIPAAVGFGTGPGAPDPAYAARLALLDEAFDAAHAIFVDYFATCETISSDMAAGRVIAAAQAADAGSIGGMLEYGVALDEGNTIAVRVPTTADDDLVAFSLPTARLHGCSLPIDFERGGAEHIGCGRISDRGAE